MIRTAPASAVVFLSHLPDQIPQEMKDENLVIGFWDLGDCFSSCLLSPLRHRIYMQFSKGFPFHLENCM